MINFISMHNFGEDFVDCRRLQIECEFFKISQKQLKEMPVLLGKGGHIVEIIIEVF